jgi:hypothetical protein
VREQLIKYIYYFNNVINIFIFIVNKKDIDNIKNKFNVQEMEWFIFSLEIICGFYLFFSWYFAILLVDDVNAGGYWLFNDITWVNFDICYWYYLIK